MSVGVCVFATTACVQPHVGRLRCAPDAGAPRGADWIGCEHLRPDRVAGCLIVLTRATDLTIPVRDEFVVRLRVERRRLRLEAGRQVGRRVRAVGGREQKQRSESSRRMLRRIARRIAVRRATRRPRLMRSTCRKRADVVDHAVDVVPVGGDGRQLMRIAGACTAL